MSDMKLKDIEKLHADGLITDDQKEAIVNRYKLNEPATRRWLTGNLGVLAALLIGGGAVMLSVQNWMFIPAEVKMTASWLLLAFSWLGSFLCRDRMPKVAQGLAVLGVGMWLWCLILLCLLFAPDWSPVDIAFIFFIGVLPIPFLMNNKIIIGATVLSSFVLLLLMIQMASEQAEYGVFPWLSVSDNSDVGIITHCYLLGMLWWLVPEKTRGTKGPLKGYTWINIPLMLLFLLITNVILVEVPMEEAFDELLNFHWVELALAFVAFLLLKPKKIGRWAWGVMALGTCSLLPCAFCFPALFGDSPVPGLILCALYAFLLFTLGVRNSRVDWVNYGAFTAFLLIFSLCRNVLKAVDESGLVLIGSGIIILVLTILLENQRRKLIRSIKAQ